MRLIRPLHQEASRFSELLKLAVPKLEWRWTEGSPNHPPSFVSPSPNTFYVGFIYFYSMGSLPDGCVRHIQKDLGKISSAVLGFYDRCNICNASWLMTYRTRLSIFSAARLTRTLNTILYPHPSRTLHLFSRPFGRLCTCRWLIFVQCMSFFPQVSWTCKNIELCTF